MASGPGKVVSVYYGDDAELWDWIRRHSYNEETSASALIRSLTETHRALVEKRLAKPPTPKQILDRAREITVGQRRRSEETDEP